MTQQALKAFSKFPTCGCFHMRYKTKHKNKHSEDIHTIWNAIRLLSRSLWFFIIPWSWTLISTTAMKFLSIEVHGVVDCSSPLANRKSYHKTNLLNLLSWNSPNNSLTSHSNPSKKKLACLLVSSFLILLPI
jgi:hypothetical protein